MMYSDILSWGAVGSGCEAPRDQNIWIINQTLCMFGMIFMLFDFGNLTQKPQGGSCAQRPSTPGAGPSIFLAGHFIRLS